MKNKTIFLKDLEQDQDDAIEKLYSDVAPGVRNYVLKHSGETTDARDVLQDGIIVILTKLHKGELKPETNLNAYLYGICKNIWRNKINRKRVIFDPDLLLDNKEEDEKVLWANEKEITQLVSEETMADIRRQELFEKGWKALSKRCQELIALRLKKVSYEDILQKMGFPSTNRVGKKLHDCKGQLKRFIKQLPEYRMYFGDNRN